MHDKNLPCSVCYYMQCIHYMQCMSVHYIVVLNYVHCLLSNIHGKECLYNCMCGADLVKLIWHGACSAEAHAYA